MARKAFVVTDATREKVRSRSPVPQGGWGKFVRLAAGGSRIRTICPAKDPVIMADDSLVSVRGTESLNPSLSSGESTANWTFGTHVTRREPWGSVSSGQWLVSTIVAPSPEDRGFESFCLHQRVCVPETALAPKKAGADQQPTPAKFAGGKPATGRLCQAGLRE
jgi:hypothetical protein